MRLAPTPDARGSTRRNLGTHYLAVLDGRHHYTRPSGKPDHYKAACAVAQHALSRGWNRDQLWEEFEQLARLAAQVEHKSPSRRFVTRFMRDAWDYAERTRTGRDPFTLKRALDNAEAALEAARFTGRQSSLALVLAAVIQRGRQQKTLTPNCAIRSLEEDTGLGKSTVARALAELDRLDYLQKHAESDGETASAYRIQRTEESGRTGTLEVLPSGNEGLSHFRQIATAPELAALDAFAYRALGRTAARVAAVLDELEGQSPKELAERLGIGRRTALDALRRLEAAGLAYCQRRGRGTAWTIRPDAFEELPLVAAAYGTDGTGARRQAITTEQRRRWHEWKAQQREERDRRRTRRGMALAA